jgi:hypothetical protein
LYVIISEYVAAAAFLVMSNVVGKTFGEGDPPFEVYLYVGNTSLFTMRAFHNSKALVLATWIIRSKTSPTKLGKISFTACKQRRVGVLSDVGTSILMLERRYFQGME